MTKAPRKRDDGRLFETNIEASRLIADGVEPLPESTSRLELGKLRQHKSRKLTTLAPKRAAV